MRSSRLDGGLRLQTVSRHSRTVLLSFKMPPLYHQPSVLFAVHFPGPNVSIEILSSSLLRSLSDCYSVSRTRHALDGVTTRPS